MRIVGVSATQGAIYLESAASTEQCVRTLHALRMVTALQIALYHRIRWRLMWGAKLRKQQRCMEFLETDGVVRILSLSRILFFRWRRYESSTLLISGNTPFPPILARCISKYQLFLCYEFIQTYFRKCCVSSVTTPSHHWVTHRTCWHWVIGTDECSKTIYVAFWKWRLISEKKWSGVGQCLYTVMTSMSVTKYLCLPWVSNQQTQLCGQVLGKELAGGSSGC
jgi:hypothetical protein